ncbi:MAG: ATP-binding protein [Nitrospiraceae bacterium]|jgi:signal transduction histidine kinase|nr:ATP-binding protein [Nitrospirota bacterium]MDA8339880.1 ATP-binding protein [Nitrospiraceae bacterium]
MKIEHKIILSNTFNVALIALIGLFALQNLNLMLTKLRFVEIADDLNASLLEMRLSEKNYFLYKDDTALFDIKEKIDKTLQSIEGVRKDIIRAVGENNLGQLIMHLHRYSEVIENVRRSGNRDAQLENMLRTEGKKLKEFSEEITRLERVRVNEIIANSKRVLFYSFWAILLSAMIVSHFVSQKILRSLRMIEKLTKSISEGNFHKIEGIKSRDELGSVIDAINSMSEELSHREEQIIQSKKLASIGVLTAGVAHELTNPLNNISMIAQTYEELYDKLSKEERIDFMSKVEGETERMKEIIKNLLDFSRPKEPNLKKADINATIQKTLKLMQNSLDVSNIETKSNLESGLPGVIIDESQIQQVFVNLITNAVQAMPGGGTIFISSRIGKNNGFVEITVADTGKGITPEFLPHIFDPFFSTKGDGGTGLGLSVSYGIIKNHRGDIRVESKVGVGTTFTIELPVYKEEG